MATKLSFALAATSALLALALIWSITRHRQPPSNDAALRESVEQLRRELRASEAAQSAAIGRLAGEQTRAVGSVLLRPTDVAPTATGDRPPAGSARERPASLQEQLFAAEQRSEELASQLDQQFATQRSDDDFNARARTSMSRVFAGLAGQRLSNAECREKLCRVVVESDSAEAQRVLASQVAGTEPFDQDVFYRYDQESTPRKTTLYVARPGTDLADLVPGR